MVAATKKNNRKMIDSAFAVQKPTVKVDQKILVGPGQSGRFLSVLKPVMATLTILVLAAMQAINLTAFEAHVINVTAKIKSGTDHLVINKVYYNVDCEHGSDPKNEWVELYNPTAEPINLKKWELCNHNKCEIINPNVDIPAFGYALVSHDASTWKYWEIPAGVLKINSLGGQYVRLNNDADMLILKNKDGDIVDQMNWGIPNPGWPNYNSNLWNPGVPTVAHGHMLARVPSGFDTDQPSDWKDLALPHVELLAPNGGEIWTIGEIATIKWIATNPNGPDSDLKIDLFYSGDSGHTWAVFATSTPNTGEYEWRVPLFIDDYYVPSQHARIKVVARGPENFMVADPDMSDGDFCPPIDYSLLTAEELIKLEQWQDNGGKLASSTPEVLEPETSSEFYDEDSIDDEESLNEEIVSGGMAGLDAAQDEMADSNFADATTSPEFDFLESVASTSSSTENNALQIAGAGEPTATTSDAGLSTGNSEDNQTADASENEAITKIEIISGDEHLTIEKSTPWDGEERNSDEQGSTLPVQPSPDKQEPAIVPRNNESEQGAPPANNSSGSDGSDGGSGGGSASSEGSVAE